LIFSGDPDYCFSEALSRAFGLRLRHATHLLPQQILLVQALKAFLGRFGVGFQAVERFLGVFASVHLRVSALEGILDWGRSRIKSAG
jgi:hypothetical protein